MVDSGNTANRLQTAWNSLGRTAAAAAGLVVALIALESDVDLDIAALRGGLTMLAVLLLVKYAARALRWSETAADVGSVNKERETR
jgi:hypothetical protein